MSTSPPATRAATVKRALGLLGPFAGLLLVIALFAILAPDQFLSTYNIKTVITQTVIVGLGAIGMTYVIVSGGIDLSVGSIIALASVVTAVLLQGGASPWVALIGGVLTGAAIGAVNGALIVKLRVTPFIVTLGTMGIARGVAKWLAGEQKVDAPTSWLGDLMTKTPSPPWLLVSPGVWLLILSAVAMAFALRRSVFGLHVLSIGSNEGTARLCGVRVPRVKTQVYAIAGLFAGLAGVMQFARLTVGDPTTAMGKELDVIAAVVIGGGSLSGGSGTILGAMIGALLMAILANGCTLTGVPNYVQEILVGAIIVAAVALDEWRSRRRALALG